jgi:PDZ domain
MLNGVEMPPMLKPVLAWIGGVITAVVISVAISVANVYSQHFLKPVVTPVGEVSLGEFVPAGQRITHVYQMHLDGGEIPQLVITTVAPGPSEIGIPSGDLLLLAWDQYAQRWFVAYDAAKVPANSRADPDAPLSPSTMSESFAPLLPAGHSGGIIRLGVAEIHDQPQGRGDLLFWADASGGSNGRLSVGVLNYGGAAASLVWTFATAGYGSASVVGSAPHQRIVISNYLLTPYDPSCCPVRSYKFVLARSANHTNGAYYGVVSDNRPWLGAFAEAPRIGPLSPPDARILSVVPGSPAAGILQTGDVITGVDGMPGTQGPSGSIVDKLARHFPGETVQLQIERHGTSETVAVTLASRASPKAQNADLTAGIGATNELLL